MSALAKASVGITGWSYVTAMVRPFRLRRSHTTGTPLHLSGWHCARTAVVEVVFLSFKAGDVRFTTRKLLPVPQQTRGTEMSQLLPKIA